LKIEETRRRSKGIQVFAITPFLEDKGKTIVDEDGIKRNVNSWVTANVPVVVACGGVGELWHLNEEEHVQVVRATSAQSSGKIVIIAGVTGNTKSCVATSRKMEEAGADGVLLFPSELVATDQKSVIEFYSTISKSIEIGIMPFRIDNTVDVDTVRRLSDLPNMLALKEESGNMDEFEHLVREVGNQIIIAGAGSDQLAPCFLLMGAGALTSSLANYLPNQLIAMWNYAQEEDFREVMNIQKSLRPIELLRQKFGHRLHKAAMDMIGLSGGATRAPGISLTESDLGNLNEHLNRLGIITTL
jgi:4-hydroxy-tetrahydrodipicolinate synthase